MIVMQATHEILLEHWLRSGENPGRIANAASVVCDLERRYQMALPEDFRGYLLHSAPENDLWDNDDFIWWSPIRVKNIPDEYEHEIDNLQVKPHAGSYLFFADYCIWCWAWAICCDQSENRGKVIRVGGGDDPFVADSFSEFIRAYMTEPMSLC